MVPEIGTDPPLDSDREPVYEVPDEGVVPNVKATNSVAVLLPAAPTVHVDTVAVTVAPPPVRVRPVTEPDAVPELMAST